MNAQRQMDMVAHHATAQEVDKKELREFVQQEDKMVLVCVGQRETWERQP
jgi:hypothetical protein